MNNYKVIDTIYTNPITHTVVQKVEKEGRIYVLKIHHIPDMTDIGYIKSFNTTYRVCYPLIKDIEGIIILYDTWVEDDKYYVLMEYLEDYIPLTSKFLNSYALKYGDLTLFNFKKEIGLKVMGVLGRVYCAKVCIVDISFGNIFIHPITKKIKLVDIEPSIPIPKNIKEMCELWKTDEYLTHQLSFSYFLLTNFIKDFLSNTFDSEEELWSTKS
jgi:serine/threonine protein kinase